MVRRCLVPGVCVPVLLLFAAAGALAQRAAAIFVTPFPNAPFSGLVEVQQSFVRANGAGVNFKSMRAIARDSAGRVYMETRQMLPAASTATPALLRIHIYDPQTRVSTMLYPNHGTYSSFVVNRPPSTAPPGQLEGSSSGANLPLSQFTKQEDLGTREIDGLQAHGVRVTQTLPASSGGQPVVVTDEYWYSDYLHLNVEMKHSDPRTGSVTTTITQISQGDPDPSLFAIPKGYKPLSAMRAIHPK